MADLAGVRTSLAGLGSLLATVTTEEITGTTVTAVINGVETTVQLARGLTPAVNDVVIVQRIGSQWVAISTLYAAAPPPQPPPVSPPAPNPPVRTGTTVISPVETRSYRTSFGWRTDNTDVYQGQWGGWGNHTGCVFYGRKPRSLDGATVTDAKIRVRRPANTGSTYAAVGTTMRLMTNSTRPAGTPTLTSSTDGPRLKAGATNDAFDIPNSWAQAMVDGTAGGLAFFDSDGSPYIYFAGRGRWAPAFTLTIKWRR